MSVIIIVRAVVTKGVMGRNYPPFGLAAFRVRVGFRDFQTLHSLHASTRTWWIVDLTLQESFDW